MMMLMKKEMNKEKRLRRRRKMNYLHLGFQSERWACSRPEVAEVEQVVRTAPDLRRSRCCVVFPVHSPWFLFFFWKLIMRPCWEFSSVQRRYRRLWRNLPPTFCITVAMTMQMRGRPITHSTNFKRQDCRNLPGSFLPLIWRSMNHKVGRWQRLVYTPRRVTQLHPVWSNVVCLGRTFLQEISSPRKNKTIEPLRCFFHFGYDTRKKNSWTHFPKWISKLCKFDMCVYVVVRFPLYINSVRL